MDLVLLLVLVVMHFRIHVELVAKGRGRLVLGI